MTAAAWDTEAAMVADFCTFARTQGWTPYAETHGWDVLLARDEDGFQIGVEAKLSLNVTVLVQAVSHAEVSGYRGFAGPDCVAILVPENKVQNGVAFLASALSIVVVRLRPLAEVSRYNSATTPWLPTMNSISEEWPERCPDQRLPLPKYVPDVSGGHSAPVRLTDWKIKAIKIAVFIERYGRVTRQVFKSLRIDPTRWTQEWLISDGAGGWVPRPGAFPDFKSQHPRNYEEIAADFDEWVPPGAAALFGERVPP